MENYKAHSRYIIEAILNDSQVPWERESYCRYLAVGGSSINLFGFVGLCLHVLTNYSIRYKLNGKRGVYVDNPSNTVILRMLADLEDPNIEINFKS